MFEIQFEAFSNQGKQRQSMEDAHSVVPELGLFVVADGVGGQKAGEVASQSACKLVVDLMRQSIKDWRSLDKTAAVEQLKNLVQKVNSAVFEQSKTSEKLNGMACTLEVAWIFQNQVLLAHVGDSRTYLIRAGQLHRLTEDHTVGGEMVRKGLWDEEERKKSPLSNTLARAIGGQEFVDAEVLAVELMPGDAFLISTDGFYASLKDAEVIQELSGKNFNAGIQKLGATVLSGPAGDNLTGVGFRCVAGQKTPVIRVSAQKKLAALNQISLFKFLTFAELNQVLSSSESQTFPANTVLIREGDAGSSLYVIVQGEAVVTKGGRHVARLGAGKVVGEMSLIDQSPRSATVTASTSIDVLKISREVMVKWMRSEPKVAVKMLWSLASDLNTNLRETTARLIKEQSKGTP